MRVTFVGGPLDKQVVAVPDGRNTYEVAVRLSDKYVQGTSPTDVRCVPDFHRIVYRIVPFGTEYLAYIPKDSRSDLDLVRNKLLEAYRNS